MQKPTTGQKFRALLATGRVANLPTVWSNVLVAFWLMEKTSFPIHLPIDEGQVLACSLALIATSLLYFGGCCLGDWRDTEYDTSHRPNRPIPRGILSRPSVFIIAFLSLALGTLIICSERILNEFYHGGIDQIKEAFRTEGIKYFFEFHIITTISLLLLAIILYAYFHKKIGFWALILMALCRSFLVLFAILFPIYIGDDIFLNLSREAWVLWPVITIGLYTFLLSSVAATEAKPGPFSYTKLLGFGMILLPFASLPVAFLINHWNQSFLDEIGGWSTDITLTYPVSSALLWATIIACIFWFLFTLSKLKSSKKAYVSHALAGFCLLDACFAATYSPVITLICLALFALALLLQRITPAT